MLYIVKDLHHDPIVQANIAKAIRDIHSTEGLGAVFAENLTYSGRPSKRRPSSETDYRAHLLREPDTPPIYGAESPELHKAHSEVIQAMSEAMDKDIRASFRPEFQKLYEIHLHYGDLRSRAIAANLTAIMTKEELSTAALVIGAAHTDSIQRHIRMPYKIIGVTTRNGETVSDVSAAIQSRLSKLFAVIRSYRLEDITA